MEPKQWVGIDVSGKRLEVFVCPIQRMLKVANSPAGLAMLVSELLAIDPALIVVEAKSICGSPICRELTCGGL